MNTQEFHNLQEAYLQVCEQETGRGPRISDTYDMRDAEGGPKGGGTIKGPKRKKSVIRKEETDLFDAILEHLVAEGYADTNDAALVIMANMSEEWRQSIVEGDALRNTIKYLEGKRDAMNAKRPGSANTAPDGKQSVGAAAYKAYQRLRLDGV